MPADEARRRIVEAVQALLRERPFRELSVDAVMARAGLARTVFYRHFPDLPSVLLELLDELRAQLMPYVDPGEHHGEPAALRRTLTAAVAAFEHFGPLLHAADEAARVDPRVAEAYAAFGAAFVEETARVLATCEDLPPGDPAELARALTAMNAGYLLAVLGREPLVEPAVAVDTLYAVWARVLWRAD